MRSVSFVLALMSVAGLHAQQPQATSTPPAQTVVHPVPGAPPLARPELRGRHPVSPAAAYHRLICLVHLTGSGKQGDPMRPEYVPTTLTGSRSDILTWSMQLSDDGKMAIVHYVAVDRTALAPILADTRAEVRVFEIGKDQPAAIEAEIQKYKKDFTLASFRVVAP